MPTASVADRQPPREQRADPLSARIAVVDYGMGNLYSVARACEHVGLCPVVTSAPTDVCAADAVVLPGVGAFGDAMAALRRLGLVDALHAVAEAEKPLIGICLGMQLFMSASDEFGTHPGLGIIGGDVTRFPEHDDGGMRVKVPHVGWSCLDAPVAGGSGGLSTTDWGSELLQGVLPGTFMYFVHSFYARPINLATVVSVSHYRGVEFCSSLQSGNLFGCQFHPERSGTAGLQLYRNLARLLAQ